MIEVKNVSKNYQLTKKQKKELQTKIGSVSAVSNVNFSCQPGRVFSLLGPNGAGKTTLLRIMATILKPSAGEVFVSGMSVIKNPQLVRSNIGFLTGSTNLYEKLTPVEIVTYFGELHNMPKKLLAERKEELFNKLEINDFSKKRIGQLSTGMKQRVSIARSMIHDPKVVIFDEPTSGLDVISANSIIELIKDCKKEGKTVIFSSHIMSEVDLLCDDLAIITNGKLVFNNTMEDFRSQCIGKSLTEAFIETVNNAEIN